MSGGCNVLGYGGVVAGGAIGGAIGGFIGALVESAIIEEDMSSWQTWESILGDTAWGAAGGALAGLVSGPGGSSAGTVLAKFLKHPIKNFLTDLGENLIMNFTNWYSQFVTEGVINSYA